MCCRFGRNSSSILESVISGPFLFQPAEFCPTQSGRRQAVSGNATVVWSAQGTGTTGNGQAAGASDASAEGAESRETFSGADDQRSDTELEPTARTEPTAFMSDAEI